MGMRWVATVSSRKFRHILLHTGIRSGVHAGGDEGAKGCVALSWDKSREPHHGKRASRVLRRLRTWYGDPSGPSICTFHS
jgi:hypothetical protein